MPYLTRLDTRDYKGLLIVHLANAFQSFQLCLTLSGRACTLWLFPSLSLRSTIKLRWFYLNSVESLYAHIPQVTKVHAVHCTGTSVAYCTMYISTLQMSNRKTSQGGRAVQYINCCCGHRRKRRKRLFYRRAFSFFFSFSLSSPFVLCMWHDEISVLYYGTLPYIGRRLGCGCCWLHGLSFLPSFLPS